MNVSLWLYPACGLVRFLYFHSAWGMSPEFQHLAKKTLFWFQQRFYTRRSTRWFQARYYGHCWLWRAELYYCYLLSRDFCYRFILQKLRSHQLFVCHKWSSSPFWLKRHISGSRFKFDTWGLRLILSVVREQKLPITPGMLRRICPLLSTDADPGFWVADSSKNVSRSGFFIRTWGLVCYGLKPYNSSSVVYWYKWFACLRATLHAHHKVMNTTCTATRLHHPRQLSPSLLTATSSP